MWSRCGGADPHPVDLLMWAGIVLGLSFTMVNVQSFAAAGAPVESLGWRARGCSTRRCR